MLSYAHVLLIWLAWSISSRRLNWKWLYACVCLSILLYPREPSLVLSGTWEDGMTSEIMRFLLSLFLAEIMTVALTLWESRLELLSVCLWLCVVVADVYVWGNLSYSVLVILCAMEVYGGEFAHMKELFVSEGLIWLVFHAYFMCVWGNYTFVFKVPSVLLWEREKKELLWIKAFPKSVLDWFISAKD